jgi:hypothetical protein
MDDAALQSVGDQVATFAKVSEKQAPNRPPTASRLRARMARFEDHVRSVGKHEVGVLTPEAAETPRSIAVRVSRAARRVNTSVTVWSVDGIVYFKRA